MGARRLQEPQLALISGKNSPSLESGFFPLLQHWEAISGLAPRKSVSNAVGQLTTGSPPLWELIIEQNVAKARAEDRRSPQTLSSASAVLQGRLTWPPGRMHRTLEHGGTHQGAPSPFLPFCFTMVTLGNLVPVL